MGVWTATHNLRRQLYRGSVIQSIPAMYLIPAKGLFALLSEKSWWIPAKHVGKKLPRSCFKRCVCSGCFGPRRLAKHYHQIHTVPWGSTKTCVFLFGNIREKHDMVIGICCTKHFRSLNGSIHRNGFKTHPQDSLVSFTTSIFEDEGVDDLKKIIMQLSNFMFSIKYLDVPGSY